MSFLEPLFLIGLLAAGLPLAIHLFNKRKAARRRFPAIALLIESNKRTARSVKLRQRLLLALRVGLLALLALAMAKPFCLSDRGVTSSERLPTAVVFVLDTSSSMQQGDWFKRAQRELSQELDRLRPWDEAALVETSSGELVVDRLSNDHGAIVRAAKGLKPTSGPGDTTRALLRAKSLLLGSQLYNRRVVLISDMAKGGFKPDALPADGYGLELRVINVRGGAQAPPKNLAITDVSYTQEGSAQEQLWRIDVNIQSYWDQPVRDLELRLELGGQLVSAGKLDELLPNQRAIYTFRHRYDGAGSIDARVELVDADDYAPDNEHLFVFRPRARIKALIVNGEPNGIAYEDEAFFLTRALNPKRATESGIIPTVITAQGLSGVQLKDYDVIFLANLSRVSSEAATSLEAYVRDGGGLLISMGDQVDVDAYNMTMGNLLPKPLRTLKRLTERSDPDAPVKQTSLGATDHQHPIFRAFSLPGGDTLQSVQIYSYMLLEPTATTDAKTLISFKDNAPALLERELGKGRVMLWTSTLDYEWSDFPVSSTYLPLLHRMVLYLARRATSRGAKSFLVGVPARIELAGLAKERLILRAQGEGKVREVLEVQDDGAVVFTPRALGVYKAWAEQLDEADPELGVLEDLTFAVNVPMSESELGQLSEAQLQAWQSSPSQLQAKPKGLESQRRVNLWPKLLFVVTLLLLMETMLGTRRVVLQKLWALVRPSSTQVTS